MLTNYQRVMTVHSFVEEVVESFLQFAMYLQHNTPLVIEDIPDTILSVIYAEILDFCIIVREVTKKNFDPTTLGVDLYLSRNTNILTFSENVDIYGEHCAYLQSLAKSYQPFTFHL